MRILGSRATGRLTIFVKLAAIALFAGQLTGACGAESRPLVGSDYMLEQASGLALGMTWAEVHRLRPAAFRDSYSVKEAVADHSDNLFYFGKGGEVESGATTGTLQAIVMERSFPVTDSAEYERHVRSVAERWSATTRQEPEVFYDTLNFPPGFKPLRRRILRWRGDSIVFLLLHEAEPSRSAHNWLLFRAIVRCPGVTLPETKGLKLNKEDSTSEDC
jgi:hypothetical protein